MRRDGGAFLNELKSRRNIFPTLHVLSIPGGSWVRNLIVLNVVTVATRDFLRFILHANNTFES